MNVSDLMKERDRLLGVLEDAKSAKHKLKQVNVLIAMYGTPEDAALVGQNGHAPGVPLYCDQCNDGKAYKGRQGLSMHARKVHGTPGKARRKAAAK